MRGLAVSGVLRGLTGSCADSEGLAWLSVGLVGGGEEGRWGPFGFALGCGCAPVFGLAEGPKARRVYSTAEAVPLRWFWWFWVVAGA